ncbi:MAG: MerR family transcriptional regulator [Bacteroidetes bacterium]|nr:MerR family transcriptional regulator [Bacteroidota bacterium]
MENEVEKLYFTIGEVSDMLKVSHSQIRFWEREFIQLKPIKTAGGTRKFSNSDIDTIKLIHQLLKEQGYTIDGAKEKLKHDKDIPNKQEIINRLKTVRQFLVDIKNEF